MKVMVRMLLASFLLCLSHLALAEALDINTADASELAAAMVGVGEKRAEAIIAYREEHGPFQSVDELTQVSGIGPKVLEDNRAKLSVGKE